MKQHNVLNLACPPIPVVRIGFIGLGNRGLLAIERYMHLDGVEVKALCDLREENIALASELLKKYHHPFADCYSMKGAWQEVCRRSDIDLIYICTDWLHIRI
jgi:predicted dehydrogenase